MFLSGHNADGGADRHCDRGSDYVPLWVRPCKNITTGLRQEIQLLNSEAVRQVLDNVLCSLILNPYFIYCVSEIKNKIHGRKELVNMRPSNQVPFHLFLDQTKNDPSLAVDIENHFGFDSMS